VLTVVFVAACKNFKGPKIEFSSVNISMLSRTASTCELVSPSFEGSRSKLGLKYTQKLHVLRVHERQRVFRTIYILVQGERYSLQPDVLRVSNVICL
jgi:hypothetical protein